MFHTHAGISAFTVYFNKPAPLYKSFWSLPQSNRTFTDSKSQINQCIYGLMKELWTSNRPIQKQTWVLSRTLEVSVPGGAAEWLATGRINGDTRADYGKPQYQGPKVLHWWWSNRQWVLIEMSVQRSWTWRPGRRAIGRRHILNGVRWVLPVVTLHLWHGGEKNQSHKSGRSSLFHQLWSESLRQTFPAAVVTLILLKLFLHLTDPKWSFFIFDQVFDHGPDSSTVHGLLWFDVNHLRDDIQSKRHQILMMWDF